MVRFHKKITKKFNPSMIKILEDFVDFFNDIKIDYWLGGGLLQCIINKRFGEIRKNWAEHDIDFHILAEDRQIIDRNIANLRSKGYQYEAFNNRILLNSKDGHRIELAILWPSHDPRILFFCAFGKKSVPHMKRKEIRKRSYHFDVPTEYFANDYLQLEGLKIRIPNPEYIKFVYR